MCICICGYMKVAIIIIVIEAMIFHMENTTMKIKFFTVLKTLTANKQLQLYTIIWDEYHMVVCCISIINYSQKCVLTVCITFCLCSWYLN